MRKPIEARHAIDAATLTQGRVVTDGVGLFNICQESCRANSFDQQGDEHRALAVEEITPLGRRQLALSDELWDAKLAASLH